jgi:hypothetical protein
MIVAVRYPSIGGKPGVLNARKRKWASTPVSDGMSLVLRVSSPDGSRRSAFNSTPPYS